MTELAALETFLAISPKSNEEQVLRLLIELGAQFVGASEGSLLVLDPRANELVFAMTVGGDERVLVGQRVPIGAGLTGLAAATHEVQIGAPTFRGAWQGEPPGEPAGPTEPAAPAAAGDARAKLDARAPEAVIAAPMLVDDALVGVITAVTFEPGRRFTGAHGELYARIAAVAGVVVEQQRKLEAVGAMSAGRPPVERPARIDEDAPERVIADCVARLSRGAPHALAHVARLLLEIEALSLGAAG